MTPLQITAADEAKAYYPNRPPDNEVWDGLSEAARIYRLAEIAPERLTNQDLDRTAAYCHSTALEWSRRREAARRLAATPSPPPPAPAAQRSASWTFKEIEAAADATLEEFQAFAEKNAYRDVPVLLWAVYVTIGRLKREALEAKVDRIADAVAALQTMPTTKSGVEWAGVFEQGVTYACGTLVTRNGGLWLSLRETTQTPGADPVSWKLIVKEGRAQP